MLGAYKKHPQAYLMYVEDCFLLSDNADTRLFAKKSGGGGSISISVFLSTPFLHNIFL